MSTKKLVLNKITLLLLAVFLISFTSCKQEAKENVEENLEEMGEKLEEMGADVKVAAEELKAEAKDMANDVKSELSEYGGKDVYNLTQVDTPPLFEASCKTDKNPGACSEKKILRFIKENAKFPKRAYSGSESLEQVLIVINKDGSLSNIKYVASSNSDGCKGCQQAAADVVGMMDKWIPANKDGKPVAVKMTIPIKFAG